MQPEFKMELSLFQYILHLADNTLILGQRLGEWCGHGPVLEQDIAMTNISLDLIGHSRMYFQYAAKIQGNGISEDEIAFLRDERKYRNCLLVEQPNGDWGMTIMRQFLYDSWYYYFLNALQNSEDKQLAAIAQKSIKEVTYHLRYSSEWVIRLGDGTEESHRRMQDALNELWRFSDELLIPEAYEASLIDSGVAVNLSLIRDTVDQKRREIIQEATLTLPKEEHMRRGGKAGIHTEHLGYILTEMQYMQRTYPGLSW